uniref:uncharacterized protein LOC113474674 n=1 Tax=Ciona intestinalis TaxID=7719 RepID=UPI000EF452B4|nr:uncharacterized protein LOC113474674 [Ciona intestinalis]|eukprot:XP_026692456.1 uncharacterized protein LOC113474674 [Ciona intestinalis]
MQDQLHINSTVSVKNNVASLGNYGKRTSFLWSVMADRQNISAALKQEASVHIVLAFAGAVFVFVIIFLLYVKCWKRGNDINSTAAGNGNSLSQSVRVCVDLPPTYDEVMSDFGRRTYTGPKANKSLLTSKPQNS